MEDTAAYTAATLTYKTWALLFFAVLSYTVLLIFWLFIIFWLACFLRWGGVWFLCVFCGWEFF